MRKYKKMLAVILAVVICMISVFAVHIIAAMILNGYSFELDNYGRAIIVGWDNSSDTLYVPEYIGDFRVSEIDNSSFKNDDYIRHLYLSDATYLDSIGMYAFANSALEGTLIIPTGVTYIGTSAFENCDSLTDLSFSSFGEKVPAQCFQYYDNLQTVVLTDYITTIERYAFYNCPNLSSVTIPRSVTSINSTAFSGDEELVIYCYTDSFAHQFAVNNGYEYVLLDAPVPTEPPTEAPTEAPTEVSTELSTEPVTEEPTTEPTQPSTEAPTESDGYYLGDVDCNDSVEIIDVTYIQRHLASLNISPTCDISHGDVDGNDKVEIIDATHINRYLVNIPSRYPIGEWISA